MMMFWANFAKFGFPGSSTNSIDWEPYDADSTSPQFLILDEKNNLKMTSSSDSFKSLSEELFIDTRVNDIEKCVILCKCLLLLEMIYMIKTSNTILENVTVQNQKNLSEITLAL